MRTYKVKDSASFNVNLFLQHTNQADIAEVCNWLSPTSQHSSSVQGVQQANS